MKEASLIEKPFQLLGLITSMAGLLGSACHRVLGCEYGMSQVRGRVFLGNQVQLVTCLCTQRWRGWPVWLEGPRAVFLAGVQPAHALQP